MSVIVQDPSAPSDSGSAAFAWERRMRPAIDAIRDAAPRALLVGNAGSGKSTALRRLRDLLDRTPRDNVLVQGPSARIGAIPAGHVLLLDDLHLLDEEGLAELQERALDPTTSLIVTSRPWPAHDEARELTRRLEQHLPAIVLGHITRSDLIDAAQEQGVELHADCVEHILDVTRGVSWLVWEALRHHDLRDCRDDSAHRELDRALQEQIAHRLDTIPADLRGTIEELCIAAPGAASLRPDDADPWSSRGYAEGLLLRNGQPVPLVRAAVRATMPVHRLIDLHARHPEVLARELASAPGGEAEWKALMPDERIGAAMVHEADRLLAAAPARAAELYRGAIACGADIGLLAVRRARAAWASGDVDAASEIVDDPAVSPDAGDAAELADVTAAIWSARGMLEQADTVHRLTPPEDALSAADAAIAAVGVGSEAAPVLAKKSTPPSALGVSMELLRRGLLASIAADASETVLTDLVRASEMYTTSKAAGPISELPAVIAAIMALNLGGLATAQGVIDDAIAGEQGGPWARPRLLLWRAWVAVQRAQPTEAAEALQRAQQLTPALSARDGLVAHAVKVAIARRYDDTSGLEEAWRHARASVLRTDIDLYLLHPLAELVSAAARVRDTAHVQAQFTRALRITAALGDPPLWTAHLHWAGIQEGILLSSPGRLAPHAKALVAASSRSPVAAVMAKAGRVWTSVLAGTVDAAAVEEAAEGLASVGMRWDAARLAGHGAARSTDRKVSARLLACARELHPTDGTRRPATPADDPAATGSTESSEEVLSDRELEVARLVVQGKTYAEIGETIFISPRTAEHHIAHIRRRLGAASRSDLLARLRVLLGEDSGGNARGDQGAPP